MMSSDRIRSSRNHHNSPEHSEKEKSFPGCFFAYDPASGISEFICTEYKYLDYIFNGIQLAKSVVPELNEIPDAPKIIKTFEEHYKKRIILFAACALSYTILIAATKMILLRY